jgi:NADH:ubiquinone oxidoreductase subunit D
MPEGPIKSNNFKFLTNSRIGLKTTMEVLINHFKNSTAGFSVKANELYSSVEAPKGELGIYLIADDSNKPYRCKIRAPGFVHLQGLNLMSQNTLLADVVAIIGTQDIVFGEIDR